MCPFIFFFLIGLVLEQVPLFTSRASWNWAKYEVLNCTCYANPNAYRIIGGEQWTYFVEQDLFTMILLKPSQIAGTNITHAGAFPW